MVQLYHNRNVNKNSLLFKVDYTSIDMKVLILGFVETIIFFMVGWYLGKIKHYE